MPKLLEIVLPAVLALTATAALAQDIKLLKPGIYLASGSNCPNDVGSAAEATFDGKNFAGHYSVCNTEPTSTPGTYKNSCLEGQGQNWPTHAQIDSSPDREVSNIKIEARSKSEFTIDGQLYKFCEAAQ
jgi:hypothetical protein